MILSALFIFAQLSCTEAPVASHSSPISASETLQKADSPQLTEEEKVSHLINYIRNLAGSTFIRNGKEFNPGKAADHLQSKYNKHKKRVKTAHDFVDVLATYSKTKEPYQIRFADGTMITCGEVLNKELKRLEGSVVSSLPKD